MGFQKNRNILAHFLQCSSLAATMLTGASVAASANGGFTGYNSQDLSGFGVWYLRGDISYSLNDPYEVSSNSELERTRAGGSIGFGFRFNEHFRLESELGLIGQHSFKESGIATTCEGTYTDTIGALSMSYAGIAPCTGANSGETSTWDAMLNAYVDLGNFGGIQPYVGGGIGVAISVYDGLANERECLNSTETIGLVTRTFTCPDYIQTDPSIVDTQYSFLWSIGAGFSYAVSDNASIDVGYRYLSAPNSLYITNQNGAFVFSEGVDTHQVRVGFRYEIR
ncbi:MAG: outer membrane protein [Rhizobiaceae bacterium]